MRRILCSTGVVVGRANGGDYRAVAASGIPCDGWEFLMTTACYGREAEIRRAMAGQNVPVFHTDKRIGEAVSNGQMAEVQERFETNCRLAKALGAHRLVHHLWGGQASDQHIGRNIASYAPLREMAEKYDLLLTIENVVCSRQDPMTHLHALAAAYPDIRFTFDTKMAAFHSQLEALYRPEQAWLWQCIVHLHVNDYAGGHLDWPHMQALPLGQGRIDLARFFQAAREAGYAGDITYEASGLNADGSLRGAEVRRSLDVIREGMG